MMKRHSYSSALLSRISTLFRRRKRVSARFSAQRIAQHIQLPFVGFNAPHLSISGTNNLFFMHLHDLPCNPLSGPVQTDKEDAYALLAQFINKVVDTEHIIDLRDIYGMSEPLPASQSLQSLESLTESAQCQHMRAIN